MQRPPPFLMGAALLFWGWRADVFWAGAFGALLLETAQIVRARWEFTDSEFHRIWDLCTILFVGSAIYLRFSDQPNPAFTFFLWFPFAFFPMAFGLIYSTRDKVPYSAFSWFLRRRGEKDPDRGLNFLWVFFMVCLVVAGASNRRDPWFYLGEFALLLWAGWSIRPLRFAPGIWVALMLGAGLLGFGEHIGLVNLQLWFEGRASEWFSRFARKEFDPNESRTAIGRVGRLKLSSRIVMKVKPEVGKVPERLVQATFDLYKDQLWRSTHTDFSPVPVEPDATTWTLLLATNAPRAVRITSRLDKKRSVLSLPLHAAQLQELSSENVETNSLGVARALKNPALSSYVVQYGNKNDNMCPPDPTFDFSISPAEEDTISQVVADLHLPPHAPVEQKIKAVENLFERDFRYTTYQAAQKFWSHSGTPLANFLLSTRAGHCEYFATATVLILRKLGIPARYAVGYAVHEAARDHNYIVRERHGHAWALAWVNRQWQEIDTTPASWDEEEQKALPSYRSLREWWAGVSFAFSEWRWLGIKGLAARLATWALIPLLAYMGWRIFGKRLRQQPGDSRSGELWPGADSDFYLLEKKLERRGLPRAHSETPSKYLARVDQDVPELNGAVQEIVSLHYRYRFDPSGIDPAEREQLKQLVRAALQKV
jgi:transglutaminase-like putative cysteine protease